MNKIFGDDKKEGKKKKIILTFEVIVLFILSTFIASMLGDNIQNNPPVADISSSITIGKVPLNINFKGSGSDCDGVIVSYNWEFGDGETSNSQNPTHVYQKNGKYIATLTVTDNNGNIGEKNIDIYAQENITNTVISTSQQESSDYLHVDFTYTPEYPDPGQKITFISNYYDFYGSFTSKFWNFGDGDTAWGSIVSHVYDKKGKYKITLIVATTNITSGETITDRSSEYITIGASPFPRFKYSPELPTIGEKVSLDASESWDNYGQIVKYHWTYTDLNEPTKAIEIGYNKTLTYVWKNQGNYKIKLIVTDNDNNTNEVTKDIIVSIIKIQEVTAGRREIGFKVVNRGNFTINNIRWEVIVNRNFLVIPLWKIFQKSGLINSLKSGELISIDIGRYRRGFGRITLTISIEADNAVKIIESKQGYMINKYVHLGN